MATESYGRTDDGIAWVVHHRLGGPWWWTMTLPDGQALQSTYLFDTEQQALEAVEDARLQAVAVRPASETLASLRARAEAAEARAAQAEADARLMLSDLHYADERCLLDDRLPLDERTAVADMARAHATTTTGAWIEAVRRILAAGGAA